ncbi:hypothetical protein VTI74DRAFT_11386 [Chaetomium olivicolor]
MNLFKLLLISAVLAPASSSPVAPAEAAGYAPVVAGPGGLTTPTSASANRSRITSASAPIEVTNSPSKPMKPMIGRREALNIGGVSPVGTAILQPLPSKGCTTTLSETYGCSWDGTTTIYPSTTTMLQQINCNGCDNVLVQKDFYLCPNQKITATQHAERASTSWSTACRPSAGLARRVEELTPATPRTGPISTLTNT